MNAGYGLSVRWSLETAPDGVAQELRDYVVGTSMAKFMFLDGLAFKTWRMVEGQLVRGHLRLRREGLPRRLPA